MKQNLKNIKKKSSFKKEKVKNFAILTGGGDCPGLNAAIRAIVKRCARGDAQVYGVLNGYEGLYKNKFRLLKEIDVSGIIDKGGTILGSSRFHPLKNPDSEERIKKNLQEKNISLVFNVGGEGTMRAAYELNRRKIPCIGVPKTIDNDLWGTDFTFGFDTAVQIATDAIDRLHTTAESHRRVMLVEVMGRHTGWIATYSGIAGGADAILIPEKTFSLKKLIEIIRSRQKKGKKFSIIVVSEDAKILLDLDSNKAELLKTPMYHDEYGNLKLGGITQLLEKELKQHLKIEVRSTILGYIQRGGTPTAHDRVLATRLGVSAAELGLSGISGKMVGLHGNKIRALDLSQVIKKLKKIDPNTYQVAEVFFG